MKRFISFLLVLISLLCLVGCGSADGTKSANFYYVHDSYIYGKEDGVITAEVRSIEGFSDERDILLEYLKGPQDISLVSPFPSDIEIIDYAYKGNTLYITLCSHIVTMSKARQVLACACLARTAMELTGVTAVHFQTDDTDFARMDPIVIDKDSILLYDDYNTPTLDEP